MSEFNSVPVVLYDGTNHEAIVRAMGMKPGDGIVMLEKPVLVKGSMFDEIREQQQKVVFSYD